MRRKLLMPGIGIVMALVSTTAAVASEEGCRFFLCIQDPDWRSNGDCPPTVVPILERLRWGHPPPPCPEAGWNGEMGYEKFETCPAGTQAGDTLAPVSCAPAGVFNDDQARVVTFTENMCVKPPATNMAANMTLQQRWGLQSSPTCGYTILDRPLREKPRFMDYTGTDGQRERVYLKF